MFHSHIVNFLNLIPDFDAKEEESGLPLSLPIFKIPEPKPNSELLENEELKTVESISQHDDIFGSTVAILGIYESTQFQSVKKRIINYYISCINNIKSAFAKQQTRPLKRSNTTEFNKPVFLPESNLNQTTATDDFEIVTTDDIIPEDDRVRGLLETLPVLYKNALLDDVMNINAALTQTLIAITPNSNNDQNIPTNLAYFNLIISCILKIIHLSSVNQAPAVYAHNLIQKFFVSIFAIISSLSTIKNESYIKTLIAPFFGSLLPLISQGMSFLSDNDMIVAQQIWISFVMIWSDLLTSFPSYRKELKNIAHRISPLARMTGSISYASAAIHIDNLCKIIQISKTSEETAIILNRLFDQVPLKTVCAMPQVDAILLLSIGVLEKTRAKNGEFAEFFEYFKADYYPAFSSCLEAMIDPLFAIFIRRNSNHQLLQNDNTAAAPIYSLAECCFRNYVGTNLKYSLLIDKISTEFFSKHELVLFSNRTISAFIEAIKEIEHQNPSRLSSFKHILRSLINYSLSAAPTLMFALLFNYFLTKSSNFLNNNKFDINSHNSSNKNKMPSIYEIVSLLPLDNRDKFLSEALTAAAVYGGAEKLSHEKILLMENPNEKVLHLAFSITKPEDLKGLLIKEASSSALLTSWAQITMKSEGKQGKLSEAFLHLLINDFSETIRLKQGLFSTKYNKQMVGYHTTVLEFLQELVSISSHISLIHNILPALKGADIIESPASIGGLLKLALFLVSVITKSSLSSFLLDIALQSLTCVLLKIIALNTAPTIFRYIKTSDLFVFKGILSAFPSICQFCTFSKINTRFIKNEEIKKAIDKQQLNFVNRRGFESSKLKKLFDLIAYLLSQTFALFATYKSSSKIQQSDITSIINDHFLKPQNYNLSEMIPIFWRSCPSSLPAVAAALSIPMTDFSKMISPYFQIFPYSLAFEAHFAQIFATIKIDDLNLCELLSPAQSVVLLKPEVLDHPTASKYLVNCLQNFELDEILQYIPQMVQSIRFDKRNVLTEFIQNYCKKNYIFQHYVLWNLLYEKCFIASPNDNLPLQLVPLEGLIIQEMTKQEGKLYRHEFGLIAEMERVSQVLQPFSPEERKRQLELELEKLDIPKDIYVPANPNYKIVGINWKQSIPLKSHAKVPILVKFNVYDENDPSKKVIVHSCIFKTNDDVRMDAMVIQLIDKFKRIFVDAGIDCYVLPYRVFATGQERGVIECIQRASSRHDIGMKKNEDLLSYYIHKYGQVGTEDFDRAQTNFVKSMAPYSVLCYLLQIKDRHNANIMIDEDGHVIHIDFGFIFDISPGGNLKFERAPFKLTQEMVNLMGGSRDAKPFKDFVKLFTKCFIAVRARYEEIQSIAELMINAGFPCFKKDTFVRMRQRFLVDTLPSELNTGIDFLISDSMNSMTTSAYDIFQHSQNNIFYI